MSVEVGQWRRSRIDQRCHVFVAEKFSNDNHRVKIYLLSHHNGDMFWSAREIERDFPTILSSERIAGALSAFEIISKTLAACQPEGECCPSCKSTKID